MTATALQHPTLSGRVTLSTDRLPELVRRAQESAFDARVAEFKSGGKSLDDLEAIRRMVIGEPIVAEFQLLKSGHFVYPGGFFSEDRHFELDRPFFEAMVRNFRRDQEAGHEPVVTFGHPMGGLDGVPADGWVVGLEARTDGLFGQVKLLGETAQAIAADRFRYFSSTFDEEYQDEEAVHRGPTLIAGAITNVPFLRGMKTFEFATFAAAAASPRTTTMKTPEATPETPETPEIEEAIPSEGLSLEDQLAAANARANAAEAALAQQSVDAAGLQGTVEELGKTVGALSAKSEAEELRAIVAGLEGAGTGLCKLPHSLRDAYLPGFETDPVAALAASPVFRGSKAALVAWGAAAPVHVPIGGVRQSGVLEASAAGTGEGPRLLPDGKVQVSDEWATDRGFKDPKGKLSPSAYFAACQLKNVRARQMVG